MPKAAVNRAWSHFFGYGFTRPIDDLGEHNAPSHPELLDGLGERFREQSFDTKELIRWITLSRAYALSSKIGKGNAADDPSVGEKPRFSHFYLRQMRPEELYQSLVDRLYEHGKALSTASWFEIDDVIDPADTRDRIIAVLRAAPVRPEGRGERRFVDTW